MPWGRRWYWWCTHSVTGLADEGNPHAKSNFLVHSHTVDFAPTPTTVLMTYRTSIHGCNSSPSSPRRQAIEVVSVNLRSTHVICRRETGTVVARSLWGPNGGGAAMRRHCSSTSARLSWRSASRTECRRSRYSFISRSASTSLAEGVGLFWLIFTVPGYVAFLFDSFAIAGALFQARRPRVPALSPYSGHGRFRLGACQSLHHRPAPNGWFLLSGHLPNAQCRGSRQLAEVAQSRFMTGRLSVLWSIGSSISEAMFPLIGGRWAPT